MKPHLAKYLNVCLVFCKIGPIFIFINGHILNKQFSHLISLLGLAQTILNNISKMCFLKMVQEKMVRVKNTFQPFEWKDHSMKRDSSWPRCHDEQSEPRNKRRQMGAIQGTKNSF